MCQPSPGPRCANHTRKRLTTLTRKKDYLTSRISVLNAEEDQAVRNGEKFPKAKIRERERLESRKTKTLNELRLAVRDYDGTKTGQRELDAKIARAQRDIAENKPDADPERLKKLLKRKKAGKLMNAWRKNALQNAQEKPDYNFSEVMLEV